MEYWRKELRLPGEGTWYLKWSMIFDAASVIVAIVYLIEVAKGKDTAARILLGLHVAIRLFSHYLYIRYQQYHRRAHEVGR